jgi:type II secretory pathway pseudopilin PulG
MSRTEENEMRTEAGMSIIEVLVSMVVMSVVLVGLGQGLVLGIRMNVESKARIANLSVAKRVMESLKSQAQYSQELFDKATGDDNFNKTFYVDADGNDIAKQESSAEAVSPSASAKTETPDDAAYQVVVDVSDFTDSSGDPLSAIDEDGESHVMVKVMTVTVQTRQSAALSNAGKLEAARAVTVTVEMVRPAV